jgi:hypothetical protein
MLLDTRRRTIPLRLIISLAIFAFKTAVVADHMATYGEPFFSREQRHAFARTLKIPGGVFMWFGALDHRNRGAFKTRYVVPQVAAKYDFRFYVFTYCVGHFVLQVVGTKWTTHDPKRRFPFPWIDQHPGDSTVSTPFWPIPIVDGMSFQWPPPDYLPDNRINALANRWGLLHSFEM